MMRETVKPLVKEVSDLREDLSLRMSAVETTLNINRDREPSIHNSLS
jgi:hypothetical protein